LVHLSYPLVHKLYPLFIYYIISYYIYYYIIYYYYIILYTIYHIYHIHYPLLYTLYTIFTQPTHKWYTFRTTGTLFVSNSPFSQARKNFLSEVCEMFHSISYSSIVNCDERIWILLSLKFLLTFIKSKMNWGPYPNF